MCVCLQLIEKMQCIRNLTQFLLKHTIRQSSKNHGSHQQGYCAFSLPIDLFLEAGSSKLAWFHIVSFNYNLKCTVWFKGEMVVGGEERTGLVHSVFGLICSTKVQISRHLCKGFLATFNLVACISGDSEKPASGMRFWGNYRSGLSGSLNSWLLIKVENQALYRGPEKELYKTSYSAWALNNVTTHL